MKTAIITLALLSSTMTACGSETDKALATYINGGGLDTLIDSYRASVEGDKEAFAAERQIAFTQLCQLSDVLVTQQAYTDGSSFLVVEKSGDGAGGGPVIANENGDFFTEYFYNTISGSFVVQWKGGRDTTPIYYERMDDGKTLKAIGVSFSCAITKPI